MPVVTIPTKDGPVMAFICTRGRVRRCTFCNNQAISKACDFPTGPRGKTCDAEMCAKCATPIAHEVDQCPRHKGKTPPQGSLFNAEVTR
jgi:hypothetical protein